MLHVISPYLAMYCGAATGVHGLPPNACGVSEIEHCTNIASYTYTNSRSNASVQF